jgi:trimeric autotransporter adhesin
VLTITGLTGTVSKVYDGTTAATIPGANVTATGLVNGNLIATALGSYATANAGSGIQVTGPNAMSAITMTDATGKIPVYGYTFSGAAVSASVGTITPAPLTVSIVGDPTETYDDTVQTTVTSSNYQVTGFVAGQSATISSQTQNSYASPDVGSQILITATLSSTDFIAVAGTNLSNYALPTTATGYGSITPAPVSIRGVLANNKVYDGTTADTLNSSDASLYGVLSGDASSVTLDTTGSAGTFSQSNVGNGLAVTASGFTLTGSKAYDYTVVQPAGLTANITPATLTISGVTTNNKVYDATAAATLNLADASLSGVVAGDNVTLSDTGATAVFSQSNVGNNLAVTASGFVIGGSAAGNYILSQPSGLTANITPAPLTVTLTGNPTKIYDGTNAATIPNSDFTVTGWVAGQSGTVSQTASSTYATPNAGSDITVTATLEASDFTPSSGTSMSNYSFPLSVTTLGTINPIVLTGSIVNNPTKVYDGNTNATLTSSNYSLSGLLAGQSITVNQTSGTYGSPNAGVEPVSATLTPSSYTAGSGTLLTNYVLPALMSGYGTITPAPVSISFNAAITGNPTKVYDGNDVATIPAGDFTLTGFQGSDSATVNQTITGQYATVNVGSQPVTANMIEADFTPGPGTNLNNYQFPITAYGTGTITPAPLTATIIGNPTKIYNGTTNVSLTAANFQISGFVNGEGASFTPNATSGYDSPNAGSEGVTANLVASDFTANPGTLFSNYTLPTTATGTGTITPAPLYVTNVYATNKTYNASTNDTLNVASAGLAGLVSTDAGKVDLTSATTGTFSQSNMGNDLTVTPGLFSISGSEAANYTLVQPTGLTANITPAQLTIADVIANSKAYDGTTADTLNTSGATLNGVFAGDTVTLSSSGTTAQFSQSNVGNNLAVTTSGFTIGGASASNYTLVQPGLTANITPAPLTVTITGNPTKTYNGNTAATLTASDYTITGFVAGQGATLPQTASASYATSNAGTGITVNATLALSDYLANAGTDLSNYSLPSTGVGTGTINPVILNLTGQRVYDADTDASYTLFGSNGVLTGINGQTLQLSGTGVLSTKNVGSQQPFAAGGLDGFTLTGIGSTVASNYTLVGGTDWVTITPATLTVADTTVTTKVYDGTTTATLSGSVLTGVLGSDAVVLGNDTSGAFNNKNVGTGKPVSTSMTISGTDASNYILVQPTSLTGTITPLAITVTAAGNNKQYDGTTAANVNLTSTGVLAGDSLTFSDSSATFSQSNVGNDLAIAVSGITASGNGAGNYTFNTTAATEANITPRIINLGGTRPYDQGTDATASTLTGGSGVINGVNGETLALTGQGTVTSPNVGTYTGSSQFSLGTLALGSGTGSASNYTLIGGTDTLQITPYILTVSGATAENKVYDGGTVATIEGATLSSPLPGDTVTLANDTTGTFASKNVGTDISVSTNMTLTGASAGNYAIVQPSGLAANITPLTITVVATGQNKVYDTTENATVTLAGNGIVAGDSITFSDTSSLFVSPNAASGVTIDVSGITASGADAGNYNFNTTATTSANITPVVLNLAGTRVYDAGIDADVSLFGDNGVLTGIGGQTLQLSSSNTQALASKNVGTQSFASGTIDSYSLAGINGSLASNYTLIGGTDTVTITPATLMVEGTQAANKVYDGTTTASLSGATLVGVLGSDSITLGNDTSGTFNNKNAGDDKSVSTAMAITGTDASNYILVQPTGLTADITPLPITVVAAADNKSYDGNTTATVSLSSTGILAGDTVNFSDSSANFSTANAGNNIGVAVDGISASGADAGNYSFNTTASTHANITPAIINLVGTQVYDGTTTVNAGSFGSGGVVNGVDGQTLILSGTGTISSKDVGTYSPFDVSSLTLNDHDGSLASNYTLVGGTDSVTITPYVINLTGTRAYDANTDAGATLFGSNGVVSGVAGETLTVGGSGIVSSADVGTYTGTSSFNLNNLSLTGNSGALASNYTLVGGVDTLTITPYVLNLSGVRDYNATTDANANLFGNNGVLTGLAGQTLTLSGSGAVSSKNVGTYTGADFSTDGLTLTGNGSALGSNYTLTGGTDTLQINPRPITVAATGGDKTYDGTTTASVVLQGQGILGGDVVSFVDTSADYSQSNVGNDLAITVAGIAATGADALNYSFNTTTLTSGSIHPAVLSLPGTRVYDATTNADASLFGDNGVLTGVDGQTLTLTGTGTLVTKDVGQRQTFTADGLDGFTLTGNNGALASNYTFVGGDNWVNITPATLYVTGTTAANRVYDGTTEAALSGSQLSGVFAGDDVVLGNDTIGTFGNKNVGNDKTVTADMTVSGTDASNYILVQPTGLTADVTPLAIAVSAAGTNKVYDGNTLDTVGLSSTGVLAGDQVDFASTSANFSDKNVGDGKTVTVDGITTSGADAGNYVLISATATTTADITPLAITIGATGTNKVFDGNNLDTVSLYDNGVLPGDQVSFTGSSSLFGDPNVGNGKTVTVLGIIGSGADIGNYVFNTSATTTANITPLPISISAVGTDRVYNGTDNDTVVLSTAGALTGFPVGITDASALFGNPYPGNDKLVTVSGISLTGTDADDYVVTDPITTTDANVTSLGLIGSGVQASWLAQLDGGLQPQAIATPYGTADMSAVGVFTGNQKKRHRPIERNVNRADFHSGLPISVQDGGVRLPTNASP